MVELPIRGYLSHLPSFSAALPFIKILPLRIQTAAHIPQSGLQVVIITVNVTELMSCLRIQGSRSEKLQVARVVVSLLADTSVFQLGEGT